MTSKANPPAVPPVEPVGPPSPFEAPIKTVQETATDFSQDAVKWFSKSAEDAAIAIGVALAAVVVLHASRKLIMWLAARKDGVKPRGLRGVVLRMLKRTSVVFLTIFGCWVVTNSEYVKAPNGVLRGLALALMITGVMQLAIWLREIITMILERRLARQGGDESSLSGAVSVLNWLINLVVWSIALLMILDNLGVNVTTMVAGLGIGGLAIGLAAQGIMADLFSALSIIFDKPFVRGDFISFGTEMGSIERVGLKATRLRALSGEQIVVSNTKLLSNIIHNHRRMDERRVIFTFAVPGDVPADKVEALSAFIATTIQQQPSCRYDRAHLMGVGERGLVFEAVYFFSGRDYNPYMDAQQAILLHILRYCQSNEIPLALGPIQMPLPKPEPAPPAVPAIAEAK